MKYKILDTVNIPQDIKKFSNNDLENLCAEIREFIVENVNITGGHLGSSLGAVEICVALHKTFDAPKDKIVFDIGHQSYAHKILTGRKNKFSTLRRKDGISGFSNPLESEYDEVMGGHSSNSISFSAGLKEALNLKNDNSFVVSVIGDSSIGAGVAFEALNHIGSLNNSNIIVILNDNNLSISPPVGALSKYFNKIRLKRSFLKIKDITSSLLSKLPSSLSEVSKIIENNIFQPAKHATFFDDLGFDYIGLIDGHNISDLTDILDYIKQRKKNKPVLLHVITKKGKGYEESENAIDGLHGVSGIVIQNRVSNAAIFGNALVSIAKNDSKIVAISAAMTKGTGVEIFENLFPERTYDVGIAEQHAVTFAAGMAKEGFKPYVAIYSTFMQRALDQVIHDVCLPSLAVRFVMDRGSFVAADGSTHAGVFDYSMFLPIPNIVFCVPSCTNDIPKMLAIMNEINDRASFIRYYKNSNTLQRDDEIILGKGVVVKQGVTVAVLSIGEILSEVLKVSDELINDNIDITVADAKFAKPLDEDLIVDLCKNHKYLLIVEEGYSSIFSSMVYKVVQKYNLQNMIVYEDMCISECWISQASSVEEQQDMANICCSSIKERIVKFLCAL